MQTLIKWPGGKTQEFPYIKDLIPTFDRYIEPFFGGGAIFFQLKPQKAIINWPGSAICPPAAKPSFCSGSPRRLPAACPIGRSILACPAKLADPN